MTSSEYSASRVFCPIVPSTDRALRCWNFLTAAVVAAIVLVVKIISGAITLISGLFNVILGVIVVLAVIALVVWMFRYAAKHK